MKRRVVIYDDPKANTSVSALLPCLQESFPGIKIEHTNTEQFLTYLDDPQIVAVIPGISGDKSYYYDLLGGSAGMKKLHEFVTRGGILMTVCAGSYLVARKTEYTPPWGAPKSRTNCHPLFNAVARGPLTRFTVTTNNPAWYADCTVTPVTYKTANGAWKKAAIAYGNGPALIPDSDDPSLEILARFDDAPSKPAAAAWKTIGKGAVLWLGILPYIGYDAKFANTGIEKVDTLMRQLKPHEAARQDLWAALISRIQNHTPKPAPFPHPPAP